MLFDHAGDGGQQHIAKYGRQSLRNAAVFMRNSGPPITTTRDGGSSVSCRLVRRRGGLKRRLLVNDGPSEGAKNVRGVKQNCGGVGLMVAMIALCVINQQQQNTWPETLDR